MKPEQYEMVLELLDFAKRNDMFYLTTREFREFEVEIEYACEKHIAEKPIPEELNDGSIWNHCPCCNQVWQDKQHYCHYCGQRIDWSVEE